LRSIHLPNRCEEASNPTELGFYTVLVLGQRLWPPWVRLNVPSVPDRVESGVRRGDVDGGRICEAFGTAGVVDRLTRVQ